VIRNFILFVLAQVSFSTVGLAQDISSMNASQAMLADAPAARIVDTYMFEGDIVVGKGNEIAEAVLRRPGVLDLNGSKDTWRWASVTKQVIATIVMQEVAAGHIDLDKPVSTYLPKFKSPNAAMISVRHLLRRQTGLPNPDETLAGKDGVPAYYASADAASHNPLTGYCAGPVKGPPGENWSYNNCDYIVAGALLQAVTRMKWQALVKSRIAKPLGLKSLGAFPTKTVTVSGQVGGKAEGRYAFKSFDAAASLYGTAADLWRFDRALMTGKLLPNAQRAEMWDGQADLGYIALGQWVFEAQLSGCAKPARIVERRGAIGGVQVRNFILPASDVAVIAFTNRDDFDFGEIWQGKGFSHELLSAAACPAPKP
jgi:D-alanyl-D-alanine carboxypeptidase